MHESDKLEEAAAVPALRARPSADALEPETQPIREEFLGKKGPASTLVEISALAHPDWMIEIEAIAVM